MINIIGFNICWLGLVYFGNYFIPIAMLFVIIHLLIFAKKNNEFLYVVVISITGVAVDSILLHFNFFHFLESNHIPFWLICLWLCFSTTLCHSLTFLGKSIWFQILAGFYAPLSYVAGNQLGILNFGQSWLATYVVLALLWSILFIFFFYLKGLFKLSIRNPIRSNSHA